MGSLNLFVIPNHVAANFATTRQPNFAANFTIVSMWRLRNSKYNVSTKFAGSSMACVSYGKRSYEVLKSSNGSTLLETDSSKVVEKNRKQSTSTLDCSDVDIMIIRILFSEIERGHADVSPYDTAWVARVPNLENCQLPQFPQCLIWIIDNQLSNGSWGLPNLPYVKDNLSHTLACIIALKRWNLGIENVNKGLRFIKENIGQISNEDWYNPIGFDMIFAAMLEDARDLCLDLPYDSPLIESMFMKRQEILKSIRIDHLDKYKSSLVFTIEGIRNIIDWNKVFRHERKDGSLFHSPSATACALMHTRRSSCLMYLKSMLQNSQNGVPSVYPINWMAGLSMVDRLERLGIARHFECEIRKVLDNVYRLERLGIARHFECEIRKVLDNVYRCWIQNEIIQGRSPTLDIINISLSFRILRWNGYDVSPDLFMKYLNDGNFLQSGGESNQNVIAMLNLYKASQLILPSESVLEEVKFFSQSYLVNIKKNMTMDVKNQVNNDLQKEVDYVLGIPWVASVERIEHRRYIEIEGFDDIQIGKTSYKIPCIGNSCFLTLAKRDYNLCQTIFQEDLKRLEKWYVDCRLGDLKFARQKLIFAYFSAASTLFRPEMSDVRIIWTKSILLALVIDDFFDVGGSTEELEGFVEAIKRWDPTEISTCSENVKILFSAVYNTANSLARDAWAYQNWDTKTYLRKTWYMLARSVMKEADWTKTGDTPSMQEYIKNGEISFGVGPMIFGSMCLLGPEISEETIHHHEYNSLLQLTSLCGRLLNDLQSNERESKEGKLNAMSLFMREHPEASVENATEWIRETVNENTLKILKKLVEPSFLPRECKQLYWATLKLIQLFYLNTDGFSSPSEMLENINAVIFDRFQ